ncbi:homeobox-DDT domain protein RLT2 isoform X1 [Citrus clementina]|uniref:homeobox-DDT domain protein RLT2 isoform X1 n=2 Tax=Citrus clementina TaxID=85681 RepID=UPI000CED2D8D|nr:homeobox-DDT domain protein RLT2 isoform X1 [Citrus x clementina]XP_024047744.1 homeobox-DDT domain protein RLT2 isoform X1 [Citrus x clementina]
MEAASEAEEKKKKKPLEGEVKTKRKMKTASQLEILEKTYAVESYPSEALRAELSAQLGLSDRQLQMWFCHRRLKDRKAPTAKRQPKDFQSLVPAGEKELAGSELVRGGMAVQRFYEVPMAPMLPFPLPQRNIAEMRAIAFVESQLGEPLREDGPILGVEFDSLPPDAFGRPIGPAAMGHQKHSVRPLEAKEYERLDVKPFKDMFTIHPQGATRTVHEYKFLPEQPTVRSETHEKAASSYPYGSPADGSTARNSSLRAGHPFMHGSEQISSGYGFPGQLPNLNLLSHQGRHSHLLPSVSGEYENILQKNSFISAGMDAHVGGQPITAMDNAFISYDRRVSHDEDVSRTEKKRKSEEARIAREVEAHEKRIRKELEKQDILRRKREEQIRKEMERQDRERRKEEERLLREKLREEERYLREQRRELERREKFLQKESIRAEKRRQKEELRRVKEAERLKVANERAVARRIAKESMALVEDERLELMELAASSKGLPTIVSLDFETLQNLDLFRDRLCTFPPKSVQLKRPFAVQPWNDSEDNIGNLLMVWRFLITFADVLGLWPFTLDEFVQAFHDYDPRLLGEIHVALLRSVIKDIEDAAKTPFTGLGANQNSAVNPGGAHPQIVEGAYAWGFDIRSWQLHLNALTWPEILRQFALSAGFGPQLNKRNIEKMYPHDNNEGNDGENIISNLRNGSAVGNAVAIMHEMGLSNLRRSRHRLTPGTVKFAAFHVLSLEGSEGLTILEVADKIQKSGLRDLTTSKTPEASIAAALSRDTKLFERTAPSTYCVRAAYRKDPGDADAILSAARERIRVFKRGFVDGEEADDAERDEERDEDSDSDVPEVPDVYDMDTDLNSKEETHEYLEANSCGAKTPLGNREANIKGIESPQGDLGNSGRGLSSKNSEDFDEIKGTGALTDHCEDATGISNAATPDQTHTDINESHPGEPWVQGLTEGEYSDLSVDERLSALVALIGVAIEGNSVRIALEERLEAANALKKQMWAETQLDKRRIKEDCMLKMQYSSYMGNKAEPSLAISSADGRQSPLVTVDDKSNGMLVDLNLQQGQFGEPQKDQNCNTSMPPEGNQDYPVGPDNLVNQQSAYAAEKSRMQLKSYIGQKAEETYVCRSLPLGQDRRRNRYWRFITSMSENDPGCGRIFVELCDGRWRLIDSEESFDALLASLDVRGLRESHLHSVLQMIEMSFKETVRRNLQHVTTEVQNHETVKAEVIERASCPDYTGTDNPSSIVCDSDSEISDTSTSFSIELGRDDVLRNDALKRYQDYERWMWKECVNSSILCAMEYGKKRCKQVLGVCDYCHDLYFFEDSHCPSCHKTFDTSKRYLNFSEHVAQCQGKLKMNPAWSSCTSFSSPLRIRLLKVLLALFEGSVPSEALQSIWNDSYRNSWGMKLNSSLSADSLVQILTQLENAIKRDYLSSNFETTSEFLDSSNSSACTSNSSSSPEIVSVLPWVPKTTAAVGLRLMELDRSIAYLPHQRVEFQKEKREGNLMKLPSKYAAVKNTRDGEDQVNYLQVEEANRVGVGIGFAAPSHGRGICGRARGCLNTGRSQKRVAGSRRDSGKRSTNTKSGRLVLVLKGQSHGQGSRKRGRRSARSRRKSTKRVVVEKDAPKQSIFDKPRDLAGDGWNRDEIPRLQVDDAENASISGRSGYGEENGQATGDEYNDMIDEYAGGFNSRSNDLQEGSDDIVDGDEEDDEDEMGDGGAEDEQGYLGVEEYVNEESDEEGIRDGDGG